jgi:hypothetical protein
MRLKNVEEFINSIEISTDNLVEPELNPELQVIPRVSVIRYLRYCQFEVHVGIYQDRTCLAIFPFNEDDGDIYDRMRAWKRAEDFAEELQQRIDRWLSDRHYEAICDAIEEER